MLRKNRATSRSIPVSELGKRIVRCPRCRRLGAEKRYSRGAPAVVIEYVAFDRGWHIDVTEYCAFKTLEEFKQEMVR